MVNPRVYTLANRIFRTNQEMTAQVMRIQSGFLASKNATEALESLKTMQEMLCEIQDALQAPYKTNPNAPCQYVSLK